MVYSGALALAEAAAKSASPPVRAETVPRERDPLRLLLDLRVRRFLTTNYDSEIEEALSAEGFAHASDDTEDGADEPLPPDPMASDSSGMDFDANHTGHMFAFVAHTRTRKAEVVHLHGRADRDGSMIVTEADYQRRYLAENDKRTLIENAMRAAFASSPLFFVGSGVGEDDIVRPLRQFVHDPTVGAGRVGVALLPMEKEAKESEKAAIRNLQRYGVHSIHYGNATVAATSTEWLANFKKQIETLQGAIKGRLEKPGDRAEWKEPGISLGPPTALEGVSVTAHPGLDISADLALLAAMIAWLKPKTAFTDDDKHVLAGFPEAVTAVQDSVTGAFLCAKLLAIGGAWDTWRDAWLQSPLYEDPKNAIKTWADLADGKPFRRNHARLPDANEIADADARLRSGVAASPSEFRRDHRLLRQRFDARAYSPTFSALIDALHATPSIPSPPAGRRIFLMVAHRGVGKGHFSAALGEDAYLSELHQVLDGTGTAADLRSAMFNLSFSHEVTSTFDQLTAFLLDQGGKLFGTAFDQTKEKAAQIRTDRVARMEVILNGLAGAKDATKIPTRMLVVFNRFSVLFDHDGFAKNAQADRLFRHLIGKAGLGAPIDLMLICGDHALPRQFRSGEQETGSLRLAFTKLVPPNLDERRSRDLATRTESISRAEAPGNDFVHFLQPARAILLAISYFPSVAIAIAKRVADLGGFATKVASAADLPALFAPESALLLRMRVRNPLAAPTGLLPPPDAKSSFPAILAGALLVQPNRASWDPLIAVAGEAPPPGGLDARAFYLSKVANLIGPPPTDLTNLGNLAEQIDHRFRDLFAACGNGRFSLTLLLACAYQLLLPIAEESRLGAGRPPDPDSMQRAFDACFGFLERTERTLAGLPSSRRDDLVLERVLDAYRRIHTTPDFPLPDGLANLKCDIATFNLMETIIWHLAVIGQPVATAVLAQAPAIADAASAVGTAIDEILLDALVLLEYRCLVFEIHSSHFVSSQARTEPDGQTRWAVHRQVQRHVFHGLRAPHVDYADSDSFAITMYASQPNDVPKLPSAAFARLQILLAGLTAYPEPATSVVAGSAWLSTGAGNKTAHLRGQLLRAAFGVLRSALSLTTLLRLDLRESDPVALPERFGPLQRGVLDEHRLMLLWLLHQAEPLAKDMAGKVQLPLYADEIVWLHNEIATIAMLQGRLPDAVAHYNRADDFARRNIEPAATGALRTRVSLNRAFADIERGRLRLADAAARRVILITDEHRAIRPVARGMLGLVHHLRGRYDDAEREYDAALKGTKDGKETGLIALGRSRAAALIAKFKGDMLRSRKDTEEASRLLTQAYTMALEGSHEDLRQQIVISQIRLDLATPDSAAQDSNARYRQHRQLDDAETYGRVMGIPYLQCEVARVRTDLQLRDGDLRSAASLAGAGLAIATANDLQLRSTWFLLLLSDVYIRRELYREARPLLHAALRLAQATEYHSAHQRGAELSARLPPEDLMAVRTQHR